jgi:DHA2 family multidrug resistance protein
VPDPAAAWHKAVVTIGSIVRQQSFIMGFSDTFYLLGVALVIALLSSLLLKATGKLSGAGAH